MPEAEEPPELRSLAHLEHELPEAELARRLGERVRESYVLSQAQPLATRYREVLEAGGLLLFAGLGGYHAHACHMAAELVVRYRKNRRALRAAALGCNPAITSAAANDITPWAGLGRELYGLARPGDHLTVYSTSGRSIALLVVARAAGDIGLPVVAFTPEGSPLAALASHVVATSCQVTALEIDHAVAQLLEVGLPLSLAGEL